MLKLDQTEYKIVMHIHDEMVLDVPEGIGSVEEVCVMMSKAPSWAEALPLEADGDVCAFTGTREGWGTSETLKIAGAEVGLGWIESGGDGRIWGNLEVAQSQI